MEPHDPDEHDTDRQIKVRHYGFHATSGQLRPSWILPSDIKKSQTKEKLQISKPKRHVPYVEEIDLEQVVLAGPVAALENGFLSRLQHQSVRSFVPVPLEAGQECRGYSPCPFNPIVVDAHIIKKLLALRSLAVE